MRRNILMGFTLCLGLLVAMTVGPALAKEKKAKSDQLNGTVRSVHKDTSTITVRKNQIERQIVYNADTKFVKGTAKHNTPSSADELKEGWYAHCWGKFEGTKLAANACRIREQQNTTQQ
jgi:hypothetical protein